MTNPWNLTFLPRLRALADDIREATRRALSEALAAGAQERVARPVSQGAGDVTYGLDLPSEELARAWHEREARRGPLSLLTEDAGWRHLGPATGGGFRELEGFDHGGPRLALDPVDGTRNLMTDLRSAWTVVSFAPPGPGEPRLSDLSLGLVAEIPTTRSATWRLLWAETDGPCHFAEQGLQEGATCAEETLVADAEARVDHGYFPFFRYAHDLSPAIAAIEADFFRRLAEEEGADVRNCYDDQYISNAGQLVLLAGGTYRFIADLRAYLAERRGRPTVTSKPYDLAGAVLCARAAGASLTAPDGSPLDFPIDTETPVAFLGYHNNATRVRLEPHVHSALQALPS